MTETRTKDGLLVLIGSKGRWQFWTIFLLSWFSIASAWNALAMTFFSPPADFWCARPPEAANMTVEEWKEYGLPLVKKDGVERPSQCEMYDFESRQSNRNSTIKCSSWEYDRTRFRNTVTNQWDLVCSRDWLASTQQAVFMVGKLLGALLCGILSDRFGRLRTFLFWIAGLIIIGIGVGFCESLYAFMALRLCIATCSTAAFSVFFVWSMEVVGEKWRAITSMWLHLPFSVGYMSLAGLAYVVKDWYNLQFIFCAPVIFTFLFAWFIPESPRWLLSQARVEDAEKIITKICQVNKRPLPGRNDIRNLKGFSMNTAQRFTPLDLFRTSNIRRNTLILFFAWFVCAFVYYGLALHSSDLGGDVFINILIGGAVEFPAFGLVTVALLKIGRRPVLVASLVLGGVACLLTTAFQKDVYPGDWPIVTSAMTGKFFVTMSFGMVYLYSAEVFPTPLRTTGLGCCSTVARFGSISAPYVALLGHHSIREVPAIFFGVTSILAGFLSLLLPETRSRKLPDTLEETIVREVMLPMEEKETEPESGHSDHC